MATDLLATQLRIPPKSLYEMPRVALVQALERDVPLHKLVSLSAPAGYGKTTLLAQWARTSAFPVAWISLAEEVSDVERFLQYLVAAWAAVQPEIIDSEVGVRLRAMSPDIDAVLVAFISRGTKTLHHTAFVIDDAHLIVEGAIHQAVAFLIDHLPSKHHFVLAGRETLPLPLGRYRAHGELLEYNVDDLNFGGGESGEFLNDLMNLELHEDDVRNIHTQLEGWPAGMQLIALSLRKPSETKRPQMAITGRHRFIADYIHDDVLARLTADVHEFLLRTSVLDRLSGTLCDAVTGLDDSQSMLERLERENLFIVPLDDTREWYRYHRLFADALRQELLRHLPEEIRDLHHRAARWYLDAGLAEPAFRHAIAANDDQTGFVVLDRFANVLLNTGQHRLLQQWLDQLPTSWRSRYPAVGLAEAGLLLFSGAFEQGMLRIDEVERQLTSSTVEDAQGQLGRVTAIRCFVACMQNDLAQAEQMAERALRELAAEDISFRPGIFAALGDTYRQHGHWKAAKSSYLTAMEFTQAPMVRMRSAHIFGALADLELRQGRLRNAAGYWEQALAVIQDSEQWGQLPLAIFGWVELRLGELRYEWNELDRAQAHLDRGLERMALGGDVQALIAGSVIAGRLKVTEGDFDGAEKLLSQARPHVESTAFPDWTSRFERCQLDLWLAQGKHRMATLWADSILSEGTLEERPDSEPARLGLVRVLLFKEDAPSLDRASSLLDRLLRASEHEGRLGVHIESLALQALVHQRRHNSVAAMTAMEHALRLAEPEGYVRCFVDLGLPLAQLLQEARSRHVIPDYVDMLLTACGNDIVLTSGGEGVLPEPLSLREQEVLQLIATGLTNREIAEALFVSPETIKKHTSNIYGKLGVGSRMEAVTRSRTLHLLYE